ncbi:Vitamin B12-binding protein [Zhongshania aliphaticivorans]|uniref:Vitamin B12-binding protein n=1 Tax=Zhongshania aliphaticivorans TaxID=1470434 RepID=A0A5S9QSR5_9GAMM|nr:cobalamin-binding protein [Zhongshania aliphaticivorans]CAA0109723.1 Vitamin B12-binding protein [Zhongshania aliphaticivorans]CAA0117870.1 Vitamin B12-binding protein [Zhongshania aliphaticivorans]CAA0121610.1 Vitamin B12-binding protein [Zhongshania aliphaticivorans]
MVFEGIKNNLRGLLIASLCFSATVQSEICVTDDSNAKLCIPSAAQRIIALSPGITELVYAAGAGDKLVAAVSFSDYPEAAQALPRVGSYNRFDQEAILALKPDLLIGWLSGNPREQLSQLQSLGMPIYFSELRNFEDVATSLERFGALAGTTTTATVAASEFRLGVKALRRRYENADPVSVFQQIWINPLMTVNNDHIISEATQICGGVNVFGQLPNLTARIDNEAVLAANPEAIIAGGMGEENHDWLKDWRRFSGLTAVRRDNLFFIPPSTIQRPTPRLLQGTTLLCEHLETARGRR